MLFRSPEPPSTPEWEGVKNATVPGSACVHVGYFDGEVLGSEDCLLLNVFTTSVYVEDEKVVYCFELINFLIGNRFCFVGSHNPRRTLGLSLCTFTAVASG